MKTFDTEEHSIAIVHLDCPYGLKIKSNIWIKNSLNNTYLGKVASALIIETGAVSIHSGLDVEKAQELIKMLEMHIETIKAAEIELIALQTKAAA